MVLSSIHYITSFLHMYPICCNSEFMLTKYCDSCANSEMNNYSSVNYRYSTRVSIAKESNGNWNKQMRITVSCFSINILLCDYVHPLLSCFCDEWTPFELLVWECDHITLSDLSFGFFLNCISKPCVLIITYEVCSGHTLCKCPVLGEKMRWGGVEMVNKM